jgi:hypothetical protein
VTGFRPGDHVFATKRLITHHLPFRRMGEAYELAYRREKSMIGTLSLWR